MTPKQERRLSRMLRIPPTRWDRLSQRMSDAEADEYVRALEGQAVQCAMLAEYLSMRRGRYAGHHWTHDSAVEQVRQRRAAVRKVLGFALPKAGSFTF